MVIVFTFFSLSSYAIVPITGTNSLCVGATTTLSDATPGGTWSCASVVAVINATTGVVTGTATGVATITYTVGASSVTTAVTVSPVPSAISVAGYPTAFCTGTTNYLTSYPAGGAWSSSDTFVATITPAGSEALFTSITTGTTIITYAYSPGCFVTNTITVNQSPAAITGITNVCVGTSSALSDATPGGTWVSYASWAGSIGSVSGIVTGISAASVPIRYNMPGGCSSTVTVNVINPASTVTGPNLICLGSTETYSFAVPGGTWSSSAPSIVAIGSTGVANALLSGSATISYSIGTCSAPFTTTVNVSATLPPISGNAHICGFYTATLSDPMGGGTWSSSNISIATVGSTNGVVAGGGAYGTATISYTAGACGYATTVATVAAAVINITGGPAYVCNGSGTATFSDLTPGGMWSCSPTTAGTINPVTGVVNAVAPGVTITYSLGSGCYTTTGFTVYPAPGILFGCNNLGIGDTMDFPDPAYTTWYSSNPGVATVNSTGRVTGISAGTAIISNYSPYVGCVEATRTVTVTTTPLVRPITGYNLICAGTTTSLIDSVPGGTWSISSTAPGTISTSGVVTGIAGGQTIITYTNTGGAFCTMNFYVNSKPNPLTGPATMCVGDTVTLYSSTSGYEWYTAPAYHFDSPTLTWCDPIYGYAWGYGPLTVWLDCYPISHAIWSSSDSAIAKVLNSYSGSVKGMSAGTALITYTESYTQCWADTTVTVNALTVAPISGPSYACTGTTITLSDAVTGGTWISGNTAVATIGSSSGLVTSVSAGTVLITYSNGSTCGKVTLELTVNPGPAAITGASSGALCIGATATLSDATAGGTWSSSNALVASVGSSSGVVTAIAAGTAVITYRQGPCGNYVTTTVTVNATFPIAGTTNICKGAATTLTDPGGSGTWSSSNTAVATVAASTGVVSGVSAGTATITYSSGLCAATTAVVTIYPSSPITGPANFCIGVPTAVADSITGGIWSSSDTAAAHITGSGIVTGYITSGYVGTATLSYTLPDGCVATKSIIVYPLPSPVTVTGGGHYCVGAAGVPIGLSYINSNTSYQLYMGSTPVGTPLTTSSGTSSFGTFTTTGTYYVIATSSYTGCSGPMSDSVTVSVVSAVTPITSSPLVCIGYSLGLQDSTAGGTWSSSNTTVGYIISTSFLYGNTVGTTTISYTTTCGTATMIATVTNAAPPITGTTTICQGATTDLSDALVGGWWSSSSTNATIGASGIVTGVSAGTAIISYNMTPCTTTTTVSVTALTTSSLTITASPGDTVCSGTPVTFTAMPTGGGTTPYLDWFKNGTSTVTGSSYTLTTPVNGDSVYCILASSLPCPIADTVPSNYIIIHVDAIIIPIVSIIALPGTSISSGQPDTLIANVTGGAGPFTYQWIVNGVPISGATTDSFVSSSFNNNDSVTCIVSSHGPCIDTGHSSVIISVSTVGIQQINEAGSSIMLIPNPNNGSFTITGSLSAVIAPGGDKVTIKITDMLGQVVYKKQTETVNGKINEHIVLRNELAEGMYILDLSAGTENKTFHFIIEQTK